MKMSKNEFFDEVKTGVMACLPKEITDGRVAVVTKVIKTNDQECNGLHLETKVEDLVISPTVYLDEEYNAYKAGKFIAAIIQETAYEIEANWGFKIPEQFSSMESDQLENHLIFFVVDQKRNQKMLQECPHTLLECGLALIYAYDVNKQGRIVIKNDLAEMENYDMGIVSKLAVQNMSKLYKPVLEPITFALMSLRNGREEIYNILEQDNPDTEELLYVLTNEQNVYGASAIFYPHIMEKIGDIFGSDYYVLPSSNQELMVLPDRGDRDTEELLEIVRSSNGLLYPGDVLSDDVFKYCYETKQLVRISDE